jgi:nuclear transport factor 2 (NTF2) superfamily protein
VAALELAVHQSQHGPGARRSVGPRQVCARRELDQRQGTWRRRWGVHRHVREALVELMIQAWQREREHRLDALVQDPVGIV